jgi:hypothetical protein
METLMTNQTVSMSEFKRNPAAVLKSANNRPVVLSRLAEQDDAVEVDIDTV